MKPHCPLHPEATTSCRCCRHNITERDLYTPTAMTLWTCWAEHQIVGPPFLQAGETCSFNECAHNLHAIAVGVWVPQRPEGVTMVEGPVTSLEIDGKEVLT